jgi:hypothetical protein
LLKQIPVIVHAFKAAEAAAAVQDGWHTSRHLQQLTAPHACSGYGHAAVMGNTYLLLLQDGHIPLHSAAWHGQHEAAKLLLGMGSAVDIPDKVTPPPPLVDTVAASMWQAV